MDSSGYRNEQVDPDVHEIIEFGAETWDGLRFECSLGFDIEAADPKALEVDGWGKRGLDAEGFPLPAAPPPFPRCSREEP